MGALQIGYWTLRLAPWMSHCFASMQTQVILRDCDGIAALT